MYQTSARSQMDMKIFNLRLVYNIVRSEGPVSRAALAKRTGLSATSMTRIIGTLASAGLVAEHSTAPSEGSGRPGTLLDILPGAGYCLCMDATVNRSKVAIVDLDNKTHAYREITVHANTSFADVANMLAALLPELCREAGIPVSGVICCGMSISGHVLNSTGCIAASSQFGWVDTEAKRILEDTLGMTACVENDCKAALIGEEHQLDTSERHAANIAYIKLGWGGVGSAAIVEGRLVRGSRNAAGEIGHFSAQPEGNVAEYRYTGSFENVISEAAVMKRVSAIDPSCVSMEIINERIAQGDARISAVMEEISEYIAIAVNDISCAYNPDTIVLNGNLVTGCECCFDMVQRYLSRRLIMSVQPNLTVRLSNKGTNAGLYGISCIAVEQAVQRLILAIKEKEQ